MSAAAAVGTPKHQLGCECSAELYNLVRERAAVTGDSMAGVLRSALLEHLDGDRPDAHRAVSESPGPVSSDRAGSAAVSVLEQGGTDAEETASSHELASAVDMIASSMAAAMKSAVVEFLMGKPEPLKATCRASGSTIGDGLWFMAEFLRLYADWGYPAADAEAESAATLPGLGLSDIA